jgi:plastocyanin
MKKIISLLLVPFVLLFLAACGGGGEEADGGGDSGSSSISVVQNDIFYGSDGSNEGNPPVWTVGAGDRIRLSLDNQGALEHNWALVGLGETIPATFNPDVDSGILIHEAGLVPAGESFSETFTAPTEPGRYTVICTVVGHYPSMQGVLEVTQ